MPIHTEESYQLDFDNLDAVDPNKMAHSPAKPAPADHSESRPTQENISEEPRKKDLGLDGTLDSSSGDSGMVVVARVLTAEDQDSSAATPQSAGPAALLDAPLPSVLLPRPEAPQMAEKRTQAKKDGFPLLVDAETPTFPQPASTEEAIIEVLKYSQKDMDAAIARVQQEGKEREEQRSAKHNKQRYTILEMKKVIDKMMVDQEKEREAAQAKLDDVLLEKEEVSSDLITMDRSVSDLLKRLEKCREIIEGYKKNEATLKACAQDYLTRIKKEAKRYQTLKAHAEEKISQANEKIAEVRASHKAEVTALQTRLRRQELKAQSLENSLDQKEKEVAELTKLCDELISKVQKR
ncbi:transforming acidic coiled-coil-containing protein 3-like [Salarias fasciatus]|uniref:transforming acidic coiled-coil-containing protein 3-like n=1 Tax=Salarias fasciatus TaxID=181472 RepID=UPI0011765385|nr:transforming acidic coiled-coil-containing protein 3-like [Salarias fasciatus]